MSDILKNLSDGLAGTVETLSPSIVRVEARRRLPATGVVWADNIIVTSHHVVEQDENIHIGLHDGGRVSAKLVGRDPYNDIAVLRVESKLTPAAWAGDADIKVGHLALALGRPGQQVQATLGVVSALVGKPIEAQERHEGRHRGGRRGRRGMGRALADGYIQTDVVMYPGFSGGPLASAYGTVYGLNTSGFSRGVSLTIPVMTIRKSVATLVEHGRVQQGYLGVGVQTVKLQDSVAKELERESGVLIVSVENDSPAAKANIYVGDIIVSLAGEAIEEMDELLASLHGELVGKPVVVGLVRGGKLAEVNVTIGERS